MGFSVKRWTNAIHKAMDARKKALAALPIYLFKAAAILVVTGSFLFYLDDMSDSSAYFTACAKSDSLTVSFGSGGIQSASAADDETETGLEGGEGEDTLFTSAWEGDSGNLVEEGSAADPASTPVDDTEMDEEDAEAAEGASDGENSNGEDSLETITEDTPDGQDGESTNTGDGILADGG